MSRNSMGQGLAVVMLGAFLVLAGVATQHSPFAFANEPKSMTGLESRQKDTSASSSGAHHCQLDPVARLRGNRGAKRHKGAKQVVVTSDNNKKEDMQ